MTIWLTVEILAVLLIAAGVGIGAYRAVRTPLIAIPVAAMAAGWVVFDVAYLRHTAIPARLIPWADVIALGNLSPIAIALLLAMLFRLRSGHIVFSIILAIALGGVGVRQSYRWAFDPKPTTNDRWKGGVCLQTTGATCSPAAAATLLGIYGIATTEEEMARLCLTTIDGTSQLGLYRGLCLKTHDTPWKVEIVTGPVERVYESPPVIVSVGIGQFQNVDPRYTREWSWTPGVLHSAVFLGFSRDGEHVYMADPGVGPERWKRESLETLWKGTGFRLVKR